MQNLINYLKNKSIHIIGGTGAEGSSILRFLIKHDISGISVHDFLSEKTVEKSFKLWHKGVSNFEREKLFSQFCQDIEKVNFYMGDNYLENIDKADIIFVPQSWRLYDKLNASLARAKEKGIPFYSLTRLYLDFAPATIIGITGTVGKGSVANMLVQILKNSGKRVYFAGNETWMIQLAEKLDEMFSSDLLILEISHRQLQDGFTKSPHIVAVTNLYPNHLDEMTWNRYKDLKLSLILPQSSSDYAVLNYDNDDLKDFASGIKSKIIYFSAKDKFMNNKSIQKIYDSYKNNNSVHYLENILAASTISSLIGLSNGEILTQLKSVKPLPARLEYLGKINGINIYDDIKSTTPWATMAAIQKMKGNTIIISGGKTKGIDYSQFGDMIKENCNKVIILKSELGDVLRKMLPQNLYVEAESLKEALRFALDAAEFGDNILISPAASFFYSDFIKGKASVRKLFTSLLQEGRA